MTVDPDAAQFIDELFQGFLRSRVGTDDHSNWLGAGCAFCCHSARRPTLPPTNPQSHHPIIARSMTATYATAVVPAPAETPYLNKRADEHSCDRSLFAVRCLTDVGRRQSVDVLNVALDKLRPCNECQAASQIAQSRLCQSRVVGGVSQTEIQQRTHRATSRNFSHHFRLADGCLPYDRGQCA
ncbi:hypothetical protein [Cupriavidus sp. DL-D2]|uniref:hypothetical protein n=1 Tax=Cupriavidus sp. DL-D2 TaxID=3144974 RepID=UPI00321323D5